MNGARVALLESIEDSDEEYLEELLQNPVMQADLSTKANALCFATRKNKANSIKILVREGADPFIKHRGRTPLYWAVLQDLPDLLRLLVAEAAEEVELEEQVRTLEEQEPGTRTEVQKFVAKVKRALNEACFDAASHACVKCLAYLFEVGADPNCYFYHDDEFLSWCTPLIAACYAPIAIHGPLKADEERVEAAIACLIQQGADICMVNHQGDTPLHWAAASGLVKTIKLMLRNGADVGKRNSLQKTPIIMAAEYCSRHYDWNIPVFDTLLDWGANINDIDHDSWTPLFYAVQGGNLKLVKHLLNHGAKPDIEQITLQSGGAEAEPPKTSALSLAISLGHHDLVKCLLQWNANVNGIHQAKGYCWSSLWAAAASSNIKTVTMLLEVGVSNFVIRETFLNLFYEGEEHGNHDTHTLISVLRQATMVPLTLKQLSRSVIRHVMYSHHNVPKIADLPLPPALIDYVKLQNL